MIYLQSRWDHIPTYNPYHSLPLHSLQIQEPEIIKPKSREMDIGGGFGDTGIPTSDDKWDELSDDSESDDETKEVQGKAPENSEKSSSGS